MQDILTFIFRVFVVFFVFFFFFFFFFCFVIVICDLVHDVETALATNSNIFRPLCTM